MAFSQYTYCNAVICWLDTWYAQLLGLIFRALNYTQTPVIRFDAWLFNLKDGDFAPKFSLSWWHFVPYRLVQRFGRKVDLFELERNSLDDWDFAPTT